MDLQIKRKGITLKIDYDYSYNPNPREDDKSSNNDKYSF